MLMFVKRVWLAAVIAGVVFGFLVTGEIGADYLLANVGFAIAVDRRVHGHVDLLRVAGPGHGVPDRLRSGQGVLTADFSKLYATTSVWLILLVAGIAVFGYYASRAGQPLLGAFAEAERRT